VASVLPPTLVVVIGVVMAISAVIVGATWFRGQVDEMITRSANTHEEADEERHKALTAQISSLRDEVRETQVQMRAVENRTARIEGHLGLFGKEPT
jgi:hypothetical protein